MDIWAIIRVLIRRRYAAVAFLALTMASLALAMTGASPTYQASSTVVLYTPSDQSPAPGAATIKGNPYLRFPLSLQVFARTAVDAMQTPATADRLVAAGADRGYSVLFDRTGPAPIIRVMSDDSDPAVATRTVSVVTQALSAEIASLQHDAGAPDSTFVRVSLLTPQTSPRQVKGSPKRALSALLLATVGAAIGLTMLADSVTRSRKNRAPVGDPVPASLSNSELPTSGAGGGRPTARRADAVTVLTVFLILLIGLPAKLVFAPLGAAGTPAVVCGLGMLLWWMSHRLLPIRLQPSSSPVRLGLLLFGFAVLLSYAAAFFRPIDGLEINAADRGLIALAAWLGIGLLAADGIDSRERLRRLLDRIVTAGTVLGGFGLLQFFTGIDVTRWYHIPGLSINGDLSGVFDRSGFTRVAGTASHPIEFGVVLALIFPLALHFAFHAPPQRRRMAWIRVMVIALAEPMAVSRSGILALTVAGVMLFATWSPQRRKRALTVTPIFLVGMRFVVPGLLGTIKSLFLNIQSDNSFIGRTDDYGTVGHYFLQSPIVGRGWSTFLPARYILLDNQYLGTLVEAGLLGVAMLLVMFVLGIGAARGARRRATDEEGRDLGQALAASIAAAMVSFVTFDAFGFPMVTGITFLMLGCAGALWRLERTAPATVPAATTADEEAPPARTPVSV
jgi:O-antigen ligase